MKDMHTGWYLVFTKAQVEPLAKLHLERQGFHVYLPLLQQHKRRQNLYQITTEPLFPRYLFIYLNTKEDNWNKIRSTRGCVSLVCFGTLPARVPTHLIEQLQQTEAARLVKDEVQTPNFQEGDRVRIVDGILANYEGIIDRKNSQQRITVLLTIAEQHTRQVSVSVHQVMMAN